MKKHSLRQRSLIRSLAVGLSAVALLLATILIALSQGQDGPKDLKGKSRQVILVPNGTIDAGAIEFHEDPNHQGDPTPSPTPEASPSPSPGASPTPGETPSPTPAGTPAPDPTPGAYLITRSEGAAIVPGDTIIGDPCDECITTIALPFPYTLYDQTFTTASVSSEGVLDFNGNTADGGNTCLPSSFFSYAILPNWTNLRTNAGGIFTSTSGAVPNRVFNIEWRGDLVDGGDAHFEVRLYEGETRFDVIYGSLGGDTGPTIGVQKFIGDSFTQYGCNGSAQINSGTQLTFTLAEGTFPSPTPLQITPNPVQMTINSLLGQQPVQLRVTRANSDGSVVDLTMEPGTTYQSSDPNVAVVDDIGRVGGVGTGSTSVVVTNGNSKGQAIINVSNFTPGELSSLFIPGSANSVSISGNYAYVAAGAAGLQIVDVSDRQSPFIVGSLDTPGDAKDVKVDGGVAYGVKLLKRHKTLTDSRF